MPECVLQGPGSRLCLGELSRALNQLSFALDLECPHATHFWGILEMLTEKWVVGGRVCPIG